LDDKLNEENNHFDTNAHHSHISTARLQNFPYVHKNIPLKFHNVKLFIWSKNNFRVSVISWSDRSLIRRA